MEGNHTMSTQKNILVPIDFSDVSQKIMEQAIQFAISLKENVRLIHVTTPSSQAIKIQSEIPLHALDGMEEHYFNPVRYDIIRDQIASQFKNEHTQLLKFRKQLIEKNIDTLALLIEGNIIDTIIKEVVEIKADMIIMGSHGYGSFRKAFVGSVTNSLFKKQICPILIVPAK